MFGITDITDMVADDPQALRYAQNANRYSLSANLIYWITYPLALGTILVGPYFVGSDISAQFAVILGGLGLALGGTMVSFYVGSLGREQMFSAINRHNGITPALTHRERPGEPNSLNLALSTRF